MGARGPKPGFKKAREAAQAAAQPSSAQASPALPVKTAADLEFDSWTLPAPKPPAPEGPPPVRPASYWENPAHLEGEMLRALGHRRGLALSAMASMTDEKVRMELKYIAYANAHDEG